MILAAAALMAFALLRAIAQCSFQQAQTLVDARRALEAQRREDNAEAEAVGKAAALEPLALNADGTIEEPILAVAVPH